MEKVKYTFETKQELEIKPLTYQDLVDLIDVMSENNFNGSEHNLVKIIENLAIKKGVSLEEAACIISTAMRQPIPIEHSGTINLKTQEQSWKHKKKKNLWERR